MNGSGDAYKERNKGALFASQKPYYLMYCIQRWLNLILDLMVACLAILLVALATSLRGHTYSSFLGVALFSIVSFSGSLNQLIKSWTVLEIAIGAISRIREFSLSTPAEDWSHETGSVPPEWPKDGGVSFRQISASYETSTEPVLKDITLEIKPGEKVGICGRTGSGKSSLISSILRLLELDQGSIEIDGLDISTIPRHEIRSRLNTLPQESFFLHGTVRLNLDPLNTQSDDQIIEALKTVGLWEYFESKGELDEELEDDRLSNGQRQLFCLARATCKSSSILIVDEATSSVDSKTDELMQRVFREKFKDQTMIVIARKLHTILDFDRVAVLDKGRVLEYDSPQQLLARDGSAFKALYEGSLHGDTDALQPPVET